MTAIGRRTLFARAGTLTAAALLGGRAGLSDAFAATPGSLSDVLTLLDLEAIARGHIPPGAFAYVSGGAGDEITLRGNRDAYDRIRLRPRILVDVSELDTSISLFGQTLPHPILLAPTGLQKEVHPEGEIATARAAAGAGTTMVVSTYSSTAIEEIAATGPGSRWFQLYLQKDRGFTRELVARAEQAGCGALCLTVDSPVLGVRTRQQRAMFRPVHPLAHLAGRPIVRSERERRPGSIYHPLLLSRATWKDVDWLRSIASRPVLLKGVLDPEDAETAMKAGVDGLIVSNHGGRNLDTLPATIEALAPVVDRVAGRGPVLVDGGIRRGTDVIKALASGASAVLIGRPYLYGLGIAGAPGVRRVIDILEREFRMAMALTGRTSLSAIDRSVLWDG